MSEVTVVEYVLGLLTVVVALAMLARVVRVPYPILFVLARRYISPPQSAVVRHNPA